MTDSDILDLYTESTLTKLNSNGFGSLSETECTVYCVLMANAEVCNGGMHAICYNSIGDHLEEIVAAFERIGSADRASLFTRLRLAFGATGPSSDWSTRLQQHQALDDRSVKAINALDAQYFAVADNVRALLRTYLSRAAN